MRLSYATERRLDLRRQTRDLVHRPAPEERGAPASTDVHTGCVSLRLKAPYASSPASCGTASGR